MFLDNQQVTEEIKKEFKKFLETNDNENTTTQNLWDASNLDWQLISYMIFTCFNAILPNLPTLSLSHRVHKTVL